MKVNANQVPGKDPARRKDPAPKKPKAGKGNAAPAQAAEGGNVYKESLDMYKEKWKTQIMEGGLFRKNKFWIVLGIVLLVVFLSANSSANNKKTRLTMQLKAATVQTGQYENAIEEVKADLEEQARINSVKLDEEQEELARNNAVEQGVYVASLQNMYKNLDIQTQRDAINNNKKALAECFGPNEKNAGTPWYPSTGCIPGTWEFASRASFLGDSAKVLWLCYADEDHSLLAYCSADYSAVTKLFTNMDYRLTRYAEMHIQTDDTPQESQEQILSIQEMLQQLAGDDIPEDPGFDADANNSLYENRESDRQSAAEGGEEYDDNYTPLYQQDGNDGEGGASE